MAKTGPNKMKEWRKIRKHVQEDGSIVRVGRSVRNRMRQFDGMKIPSELLYQMFDKNNLILIKKPDNIDVVNNEGESDATV